MIDTPTDSDPRNSMIEVRRSKIEGRGVFARAPITEGQVVIEWRPLRRIPASDVGSFAENERHYLALSSVGDFLLMGVPERYVNHSCRPNTTVKGEADVAIRDIQPGEEITSDYGDSGNLVAFQCHCGSGNCRGWVGKAR